MTFSHFTFPTINYSPLLFYNCPYFVLSIQSIIIKYTMNLYNNLPEYGKELLRSLDPDHELDRL